MYNDIEKTVDKTIKDHNMIPQNGHIVIGLSGGPDSMCLFHILTKLKSQYDFSISAVHVNHKFRPGDAEKDQAFVEEFCQQNDISCYTVVVDVNQSAEELGETSEEAGRRVRYEAFDTAAMTYVNEGYNPDSVVIAVAQNMDDQVETIIMRILRGTGTDGLSGIPHTRKSKEGFRIIRPLLDVPKRAISQYCQDNQLNPCIDKTNYQAIYHRNKIRLELIPLLKAEYNFGVEESLVRLGKIAEEDKEYFDQIVEDMLTADSELHDDGRIIMDLKLMQDAHPSVKRRGIIKIFHDMGLVKDISYVHLEAAQALIQKGETGKSMDFPGGFRMRISYDKLIFERDENYRYVDSVDSGYGSTTKADQEAFIYLLDSDSTEGEIPFSKGGFRYKIMEPSVLPINDKNSIALDVDELLIKDEKLKLRTRKSGDKIYPEKMKGSKKIQDLFTDMKVDRKERDQIPLLVLQDEILWVPGLRKSGKFQVNQRTKKAVYIEWTTNI